MLLLVIFIFAIGYWVGKDKSNSPTGGHQAYGLQRIINALVYTAQEEIGKAKSKATKAALQKVIDAGYREQYGFVPGETQDIKTPEPQSQVASGRAAAAPTAVSAAAEQSTQYVQGPNLVQQTPPRKQDVDNTSLMLYFGAFLFITSIGLFVAFADISGSARTWLVFIVATAMYIMGSWLHDNKKKLEEVGITFVAIGMSALPFVGLAAYYYVYDEQYGPIIWLLTSVGSLTLYLATLIKLRNTFVSFMLIGSIVSLLEATVSIIEAPAYYYIWMMIVVGVVLQFVSMFSQNLPELKDSSAQSSRVLVPLTLIASLFVVGGEGYWQLAVSLMLGSAYYLMQYYTAREDRWMYMLGSHALFVTSIALGGFAINEQLSDVSGVLLMITAVHILLVATLRVKESLVFQRFMDVSLVTAIAAIMIGMNSSLHLTLAFLLTIILGMAITARTWRHDSFVLTITAWVIFSIIAGQVFPEHAISSLAQSILSFSFVLPLLVLVHDKSFAKLPGQWLETLKTGIVALHVISIVFAYVHGEYSVLVVSVLAIVNVLVLAESLREKAWAEVAVVYTFAPIGYVILALNNDYLRDLPLFTWSVIVGLLINIFIALHHKVDSARWASSAAWLALPFALGIEKIGAFDLDPTLQMWLYLAVAIALSVSRAIARGRLLSADSSTLKSMARESSASYELGLMLAAVIASLLAFASTESVASSTLVILLAGTILTAGGTLIERTPQYVAVLPFVIQLAILRLLEPYDSAGWLSSHDNIVHAYVLLSSAVAALSYAWVSMVELSSHNKQYVRSIRASAVATTFVAPASVMLFGEVVWAMPATLILAALIMLHNQWQRDVGQREMVGFVGLAGVYWLMYVLGVRNIQAYTHVLAALLGFYGYVRYILKDQIKGNEYLGYMLGVSTIPLGLQALSGGEDAGLYGIWLLLESVGFFLIGITIRNELVTRWGLYVAIGSVLYQLRGLGWAMLSVLALVIIGIAAYRAVNQPDEPEA